MYYLKTSEITWLEVKAYKLVVALAKYLQKNEFAYITGFSSSLYKTISAAEARISTTSTPRSYISAMLLAFKIALILLLRHFWTLNLSSFKQRKGDKIYTLHFKYTYITLFTARSRIFLPAAILCVALSWPPPKPTVFAKFARWQLGEVI